MAASPIPIVALAFVALLGLEPRCVAQAKPNSFAQLEQLLTRAAPASPDPCGKPRPATDDLLTTEVSIFDKSAKTLAEALNASSAGALPQGKATETLQKLEALGKSANASWPDENRLHFQLFDMPPLLALKMTFGVQARFFVFAVRERGLDNQKGNHLWEQVGSDEIAYEHPAPRSWLDIYPLQRGPSGRVRFLAGIGYTGCAGSSGLAYEGYEWNSGDGILKEIIKQGGVVGMDEAFDGHKPTAKDPFAPVGVLQTTGSKITLPYCWFSAVDYWDNPNLCAVDTYDLSGDDVSFRSRGYNRPELVPIAKLYEYAKSKDYPAMSGYCASSAVARRMIRKTPTLDFAENPRTIRQGNRRARIEFGNPPSTSFEVEKRGDRWVVVSFRER